MSNRIEVQYKLAQKYNSNHVCINWKKEYKEETNIDLDDETKLVDSVSLYNLSQKTKGLMYKLFGKLNSYIPFNIKTMRVINKIFFGSLESYPLCGSVPFVKKELINTIKFRQLNDRVWYRLRGEELIEILILQLQKNTKTVFVLIFLFMYGEVKKLVFSITETPLCWTILAVILFANLIADSISPVSTYFISNAAKKLSPAPEVSFTSTLSTGNILPLKTAPSPPLVQIILSSIFFVINPFDLSYS